MNLNARKREMLRMYAPMMEEADALNLYHEIKGAKSTAELNRIGDDLDSSLALHEEEELFNM